jgi:cytochrome c oxidase subunit 2
MRISKLNPLLYVVISAIALSTTGCATAPKATHQVSVTMKKYEISPAEIRIKRGEEVEFHISTTDVQHGFAVPALGINEPVQPLHPAVFAFTPQQKGEFEVKCGVLCGAGHDRMQAKLIVE